jgi:hypothetical protein
MTVTAEKVEELRAVASFWKFRVDESKRHLERLVARKSTHPDDGHTYLETLIEMKSRELGEWQRGLRKAQANFGRALEQSGISEPMPRIPSMPGMPSMPNAKRSRKWSVRRNLRHAGRRRSGRIGGS